MQHTVHYVLSISAIGGDILYSSSLASTVQYLFDIEQQAREDLCLLLSQQTRILLFGQCFTHIHSCIPQCLYRLIVFQEENIIT